MWLSLFLLLLTTSCPLSAKKRTMGFNATNGYFSGMGMGCAVEMLNHNTSSVVFDNQAGLCDVHPGSNLPTETSTHFSLVRYEPLFEMAKEVTVAGSPAINQSMPIVVDIRPIDPKAGEEFLTEFHQNGEVWVAFKIIFGNMDMDLQLFNTSMWTKPSSRINILRGNKNIVRITFTFKGDKVEVFFGKNSVYEYEDLYGFQNNQTVRYYSNLSNCYRIFWSTVLG